MVTCGIVPAYGISNGLMVHLNFLYHPILFQAPLFSIEYILKALVSMELTP